MKNTKNKTGLIDSILIALIFAFLIIGAHQTWVTSKTEGLVKSFFLNYWLFMFALLLMMIRQIRKNKADKNKSEK